jgi:hypothetical protein
LRQPLTERYREPLAGVLSCYDRIIVTGTLPGASRWARSIGELHFRDCAADNRGAWRDQRLDGRRRFGKSRIVEDPDLPRRKKSREVSKKRSRVAFKGVARIQLVQGNAQRAGATVDALSRGDAQPPDVEVVRTPRAGTAVTHRLLVLADPAEPAAGWPTDATQVRAKEQQPRHRGVEVCRIER